MFLLFVDLVASCEKVIHSFIPGTPGGGLNHPDTKQTKHGNDFWKSFHGFTVFLI